MRKFSQRTIGSKSSDRSLPVSFDDQFSPRSLDRLEKFLSGEMSLPNAPTNAFPNDVLMKIFENLSLQDRISLELVSKNFLGLLRNAPPNSFSTEKGIYLLLSKDPDLRRDGIPIQYKVTSESGYERMAFPWQAPERKKIVIFHYRPIVDSAVLKSLVVRLAPFRVHFLDHQTNDVFIDFLFFIMLRFHMSL